MIMLIFKQGSQFQKYVSSLEYKKMKIICQVSPTEGSTQNQSLSVTGEESSRTPETLG